MAEREGELKPLDEGEKLFFHKAGLKLNIQKTEIMASGSISSLQLLSRVQLFATP